MGKGVGLALAVWLVMSSALAAYGQVPDIRASEQAYYDRVTSLKDSIAEGWTEAQVIAVMGAPDRKGTRVSGAELIELWGYRGYEVAIEFRNGLVSN
ncbi:MAG: hypothetical protein ACRDPR_00925, partial [Nocardioidaceae bacterium]